MRSGGEGSSWLPGTRAVPAPGLSKMAVRTLIRRSRGQRVPEKPEPRNVPVSRCLSSDTRLWVVGERLQMGGVRGCTS